MLNKKEYLDEVKNSLTIDDIEKFLIEMGGDPIRQNNILISKTICHGGDSHKLYYYDNTKLFKCYTNCENNTFDIFGLVLKIKHLANERIIYWSKEAVETSRPWDLPDALHYVLMFFGLEAKNEDFFEKRTELQDWKIFEKFEAKELQKSRKQIVSLNVFDDNFLKNFPQPKIKPWIEEGITQEIMNLHNIYYDPKNQGIIIPHYNIHNQLIGIRERTLIREEEEFGKYKPAIINNRMFNHPLGFNLYNINNSFKNIRKIKKAIIFEGEKSSLKYSSYFGMDNDISVAACGSSLINYQVELLLSLGIDEIVIGFDRQYEEVNDLSWRNWTKKLYQIHGKYGSRVTISFLWDDPKNHLLEYKDSPVDRGPDVFQYLFKNRIQI